MITRRTTTAPASDPYDLARFVEAQNSQSTYEHALDELRAGRKVSHWMWFVFPQLAGLGRSETARRFAISGADEARAYVRHPVLGPRLRTCSQVVADTADLGVESIFGAVDAMKLQSSMTLFGGLEPGEPVFAHVLSTHFGGEPDPQTLALLG